MGQAGVGGKPGGCLAPLGLGGSKFLLYPKGKGSEGQVDGRLVCRVSPIPRCLLPAPLLPAASLTLSFSAQQLLEAAFQCAESVSLCKSFTWQKTISFYWIFLLD